MDTATDGQYGRHLIQAEPLTGEYSANLFHIEAMVGRKDKGNGAKVQVQDRPAECDPEGKEEHNRFGEQEI